MVGGQVSPVSSQELLQLPPGDDLIGNRGGADEWSLDSEDLETLTRGPMHEAFGSSVGREPSLGQIVPAEPPEEINEVPPEAPEHAGAVQPIWIPGYWSWDEDRHDFLWISGAGVSHPRVGSGRQVTGLKPKVVGGGSRAIGESRKSGFPISRRSPVLCSVRRPPWKWGLPACLRVATIFGYLARGGWVHLAGNGSQVDGVPIVTIKSGCPTITLIRQRAVFL